MDAAVAFVVFKAILGFGLPIAVCTQQLIVTKRAIRRDREAAERAAAQSADVAAPALATAADGAPARQRELEPA